MSRKVGNTTQKCLASVKQLSGWGQGWHRYSRGRKVMLTATSEHGISYLLSQLIFIALSCQLVLVLGSLYSEKGGREEKDKRSFIASLTLPFYVHNPTHHKQGYIPECFASIPSSLQEWCNLHYSPAFLSLCCKHPRN